MKCALSVIGIQLVRTFLVPRTVDMNSTCLFSQKLCGKIRGEVCSITSVAFKITHRVCLNPTQMGIKHHPRLLVIGESENGEGVLGNA